MFHFSLLAAPFAPRSNPKSAGVDFNFSPAPRGALMQLQRSTRNMTSEAATTFGFTALLARRRRNPPKVRPTRRCGTAPRCTRYGAARLPHRGLFKTGRASHRPVCCVPPHVGGAAIVGLGALKRRHGVGRSLPGFHEALHENACKTPFWRISKKSQRCVVAGGRLLA